MSENRGGNIDMDGRPGSPGSQEGDGAPSWFPLLPEVLARARRGLQDRFPHLRIREFDDRLEVELPTDQLVVVCALLREEFGYRTLMSLTAVDWKDRFELVYHLYRLDSQFPIVLRSELPHLQAPEAPSVMQVWPGADYQEREVYDLMGIVFTGHPDLRRILLDDDFPGHPLRKDWEGDPDSVLVPHLRLPGHPGAKPGRTSTGRFLPENRGVGT